MPRRKRKKIKTYDQRRKFERKQRYAREQLKKDEDYLSGEEITILHDNSNDESDSVTSSIISNRTSSKNLEEDSIGSNISEINESDSSIDDEEENNRFFKFSIKQKTFKHAAMYYLVENFEITRKSRSNEQMIKATMKHLKVYGEQYKSSIVQIIEELYNKKINKEQEIVNKGGRPPILKHDSEMTKVIVGLLENGFSLRDTEWAINTYYNGDNISVKSIRTLIKSLKGVRTTVKSRQQGSRDRYSDWSKARFNICRQFLIRFYKLKYVPFKDEPKIPPKQFDEKKINEIKYQTNCVV